MLGMEEVLCELNGEERNSQGLPPGFRFHPTDEELLTIYLASKLRNNNALHAFQIAEVDLNRCEPWDLPDVAKMGEREWYFFSFRDRKYPTGLRTNRATGAGYWKATGKDKEVYSSEHNQSTGLIGMKKTLVFYKGRAPRGHKTKWVMHEYRLHQTHFSSYRHTSLKEEWVICRIHHKTGEKKSQPCLLDHQGPPTNCLPALLEYCHDQSQNYPMHTMHMQQQDNTNFLIHDHQQNDLKTLISNSQSQSQYPLFHPINNGFQIQPSFLPTTPTNTPTLTSYKNNPSSPLQSILFKSLFSHEQQQQDSTSHHGIPKLQKQCKTEDNCSSHLEMPAANVNYPNTFNYLMMNNEKDHQNPWLFDNLDYTTVFGFSPAAASAEATTVDHADTSPSDRAGWAFRPSTFDTVPPNLIKLVPAESWPMPMDHASG